MESSTRKYLQLNRGDRIDLVLTMVRKPFSIYTLNHKPYKLLNKFFPIDEILVSFLDSNFASEED